MVDAAAERQKESFWNQSEMFTILICALFSLSSYTVHADMGRGLGKHTMVVRRSLNVNGPCEVSNATTNSTLPLTPRFVHLSCYKDVSLDDALNAKEQCLGAFQAENPSCLTSIIASGNKSFGCDVFVVYSFASKQCRLSYQSDEKTNTGCVLFQNLKLGGLSHRKKSKLSDSNYEC